MSEPCEMEAVCYRLTLPATGISCSETRLLVVPPQPETGIYHKREQRWCRHPASLFTASELCSLMDFVHDGCRLLAFAYRFGDVFTQTNLGPLAPAFGCLLNDDAILDLSQLKATTRWQLTSKRR